MVEGKQTRPSDPEELIRLSAKGELLQCYNCGGEGKLHEVNVYGNVMLGIQCENCGKSVMHIGTKLEYVRKPFHTEKKFDCSTYQGRKRTMCLGVEFPSRNIGAQYNK